MISVNKAEFDEMLHGVKFTTKSELYGKNKITDYFFSMSGDLLGKQRCDNGKIDYFVEK